MVRLLVLVCAFLSGCLSQISLDDFACTVTGECLSGYVCDTERGACVQSLGGGGDSDQLAPDGNLSGGGDTLAAGGDTLAAGGDTLAAGGDATLGGDLAVGDTVGGDNFFGDAFNGDAFNGDAFNGDAFNGDAFNGDAFAGDSNVLCSDQTNCCAVSSLGNAGAGTLRGCITDANLNPGTRIIFEMGVGTNQTAGADTWWRFTPLTALPPITADDTLLDGTQLGTPNSRGPAIQISGTSAAGASGLVVAGDNVVIRSVAISNFVGFGILVTGDDFELTRSYIGASAIGGAGGGNGAAGIEVTGSDAIIGSANRNGGNLITFNGTQGVMLTGGAARSAIVGNVLHSQVLSPIYVNADDALVVGNVVFNNATCCAYDELVLGSGSQARIYHNTVFGAPGDGVNLGTTNVTMQNNIIVGSAQYGVRNVGGSFLLESHNLITGAGTNPANGLGQAIGVTLDASDLDASPLFVNVSVFNFRLTACTSPAINAGIDLGADQPDVNGGAPGLFNGSAPDLGAFETDCP